MAYRRRFFRGIVGICEVGLLRVPVVCAEIVGLLAELERDDFVHGRGVAATAVLARCRVNILVVFSCLYLYFTCKIVARVANANMVWVSSLLI